MLKYILSPPSPGTQAVSTQTSRFLAGSRHEEEEKVLSDTAQLRVDQKACLIRTF